MRTYIMRCYSGVFIEVAAYTSQPPSRASTYVRRQRNDPHRPGSGLRAIRVCTRQPRRNYDGSSYEGVEKVGSFFFDFYARLTLRPFILMLGSPRIINLDRRRDPSRSIFNFFSRITASPPFRFSNSPRRSIDHSLLLRRMKCVYIYGFLRGFRVSKLGRVRRRASFAYL